MNRSLYGWVAFTIASIAIAFLVLPGGLGGRAAADETPAPCVCTRGVGQPVHGQVLIEIAGQNLYHCFCGKLDCAYAPGAGHVSCVK